MWKKKQQTLESAKKIIKTTINNRTDSTNTNIETQAHTHSQTHNKKGKRSQSHARLAPLRHRQLGSTGPIDVLHCALHSIRLVEAVKFY